MNNVKLWLAAILGAFCLSGCDKAKDALEDEFEIVIPASSNQPGIGNTDGEPEGTTWVLPEGVRIVRRPGHRFDPSPDKLYGASNSFYADISFVNERPGGGTVNVEFPPGLVVVSTEEGRFQNGLNIDRFVVPVPPTINGTGGRDTTTIYLGVACLNAHKAFPWEENSAGDIRDYPIGRDMYNKYIVTTDASLLKLLEECRNYPRLRLTRHWNPRDTYEPGYEEPEWQKIYSSIGELVWAITDAAGVTRGQLKNLRESLKSYR